MLQVIWQFVANQSALFQIRIFRYFTYYKHLKKDNIQPVNL